MGNKCDKPIRCGSDESKKKPKGPTGPIGRTGPTGPTGPCCTGATGATGPGAGSNVVVTSTNLQLPSSPTGAAASQDTVFSTGQGLTITLPSAPIVGDTHVITANGGDLIVSGGGIPLQCDPEGDGLLVPNGTTVEFIYTPSGMYVLKDELLCCTNNPYLKQPEWHINAETGNDLNDGLTEETALKTWAELQCRWTIWGIIDVPEPRVLYIYVDSDLPSTDPITMRNFLGSCTNIDIKGKKKVLASGVVASVVEKNRATNTPYGFTPVAPIPDFLGKVIVNTTPGPCFGSRSYIARYEADETITVKDFVQNLYFPDVNPDVPFLGCPLTPGDTFDILDYSEVTVNEVVFGRTTFDLDCIFGDNFQGIVGVQFEQLHIRPGGVGEGTINDGGDLTWRDCIIDKFMYQANQPAGFSFINCCLRGGAEFNAHIVFDTANLWLPTADAGYPGGGRVNSGNQLVIRGDTMRMGSGDGFIVADIQVGGTVDSGPTSFFYCFHTAFPNANYGDGGKIIYTNDDFILNDLNAVILWGKGNAAKIFMEFTGIVVFNQFNDLVGGVAGLPLPTIEYRDGPGGTVFQHDDCEINDQLHAFDNTGRLIGAARCPPVMMAGKSRQGLVGGDQTFTGFGNGTFDSTSTGTFDGTSGPGTFDGTSTGTVTLDPTTGTGTFDGTTTGTFDGAGGTGTFTGTTTGTVTVDSDGGLVLNGTTTGTFDGTSGTGTFTGVTTGTGTYDGTSGTGTFDGTTTGTFDGTGGTGTFTGTSTGTFETAAPCARPLPSYSLPIPSTWENFNVLMPDGFAHPTIGDDNFQCLYSAASEPNNRINVIFSRRLFTFG